MTHKESTFRSDITSRPDGPANHTGSNIGALFKAMTKTTRVRIKLAWLSQFDRRLWIQFTQPSEYVSLLPIFASLTLYNEQTCDVFKAKEALSTRFCLKKTKW